jgi:hypothetical protein
MLASRFLTLVVPKKAKITSFSNHMQDYFFYHRSNNLSTDDLLQTLK